MLRARQLKIPVIIAPASNASAQEIAGIGRADAVLAVTDDEAVNLEIALVAKNANPGVRVVARVFDHDLAGRVERRLKLGATRSVSMLAAPAFAAAALGRRREVIFPIGRRVLLFTEITAQPGSTARSASRLQAGRESAPAGSWPGLRRAVPGTGAVSIISSSPATGSRWWPPGPDWPGCFGPPRGGRRARRSACWPRPAVSGERRPEQRTRPRIPESWASSRSRDADQQLAASVNAWPRRGPTASDTEQYISRPSVRLVLRAGRRSAAQSGRYDGARLLCTSARWSGPRKDSA